MALLMILSLIFAVWGIVMHAQVSSAEAAFHDAQRDYFGQNSNADRDAAPAGSALNAQLAEIQNTPSELLRLKLVGVGKILTGIFILLFAILMALMMMPMKLGMVLKGGKKKR